MGRADVEAKSKECQTEELVSQHNDEEVRWQRRASAEGGPHVHSAVRLMENARGRQAREVRTPEVASSGQGWNQNEKGQWSPPVSQRSTAADQTPPQTISLQSPVSPSRAVLQDAATQSDSTVGNTV